MADLPDSIPSDIVAPIDFVLIEFPKDGLTGEVAPALLKLVEQGIVRVFDVTVIQKNEDGSYEGVEVTDIDRHGIQDFRVFGGAQSGLLGDEDIGNAAEAMEPGTVAALIVYENTWAAPFVAAVLNSGGQMIASQRIPVTDVLEALDALEEN